MSFLMKLLSKSLPLFCLLSFAFASEEPSLITRNPFAPPQLQLMEPEPDQVIEDIVSLDEDLEFCSSHNFGSERQFSIFLKKQNRNVWLKLQEQVEGYRLIDYVPEQRMLLVEKNEQVDVLMLREANQLALPNNRRISPRKPSRVRTQNFDQRLRSLDKSAPEKTEKPPRVMPVFPQNNFRLPKRAAQKV